MTDHDHHRWEDDGGPPAPTDFEVALARRILIDDPQRPSSDEQRLCRSRAESMARVAVLKSAHKSEVPPKNCGRVSFAMGMMNLSAAEADPTYAERYRKEVERLIREETERDYPPSNAPFLARCVAIVERIAYRNWWFECGPQGDAYRIRVAFPAVDRATGESSVRRGRHWLLTPDMSDADIVRTALLAVLTAEEHEARESFLVDGRPLFGPHFQIPA